MSHNTLHNECSELLIRDALGQYRLATGDEVLKAARQVIGRRVRRGTSMSSSHVVRDYLRTKLAELEHEVFVALLLDSQNRLIEYIELFRGTLAQTSYFAVAVQEYLHAERRKSPMHSMLPSLSRMETESVALYFASQTPTHRTAPSFGNPGAGEPLTAVCGGCHGSNGVSTDSATPSLAGQDPRYLLDAIKAYRTTRKRENMRAYVASLSDRDIENIAAFYTVQKSRPAERGQTIVQDLTNKCNRCHAPDVNIPAMAIPKISGQDRDYLVMALRGYRDDRRESSMMHKMSLPYSDSVIDSVATFYASQPAR